MNDASVQQIRPTVLFIGDIQHTEFQAAFDNLAGGCDQLVSCQSMVEAIELLAGGMAPVVIVIAQIRRGQFSATEVEQLRNWAPLARIIGLLGSWCEGETRSGSPWPGVVRCYWHQWPPRHARELMRVLTDGNAAWGLPPTCSDEERLMQSQRIDSVPDRGLVAILADNESTAGGLVEACRLAGYATVTLDACNGLPVHGADTLLWDISLWSPSLPDQVGNNQQLAPGAAVIALLCYPRLHEQQSLIHAGVAAVVSKPFLLDDLVWQIEAARAPSPKVLLADSPAA